MIGFSISHPEQIRNTKASRSFVAILGAWGAKSGRFKLYFPGEMQYNVLVKIGEGVETVPRAVRFGYDIDQLLVAADLALCRRLSAEQNTEATGVAGGSQGGALEQQGGPFDGGSLHDLDRLSQRCGR